MGQTLNHLEILKGYMQTETRIFKRPSSCAAKSIILPKLPYFSKPDGNVVFRGLLFLVSLFKLFENKRAHTKPQLQILI